MPEDVAASVARLKARCDQARDARIRAEHAREQAEQTLAQAMAAFKSEFGVETPEQSQSLLADLDRQIAEEAARIERELGPS